VDIIGRFWTGVAAPEKGFALGEITGVVYLEASQTVFLVHIDVCISSGQNGQNILK
jgi:hypothetical protein